MVGANAVAFTKEITRYKLWTAFDGTARLSERIGRGGRLCDKLTITKPGTDVRWKATEI